MLIYSELARRAQRAVTVVLLSLLLYSPAMACDKWPLSPGTLIRQYEIPSGLTIQEFDTDGDGIADYGTATPPESRWPIFYARGFDAPGLLHDPISPFVASIVWRDMEGKGECKDIKVYFIRGNKEPFNFDRKDKLEVEV